MASLEERINRNEEKIDRLESMMMRVLYVQQQTQIEIQELKEEMKEFKDEMQKTVEEMKKDTQKLRQDMNKKWGEMANKLGTIVEDIIAPATSPVIKRYFNCEVNDLQVRRKKKDIKTGLKDEFDVIAVSDECETVFLIEVKSYPKVEYINEFKDKKIDRFFKLFPEYSSYKLVPIFASLRLEDDILNYLTKNKIYAMAYREWDYMDLLNFDKI
ncbi:hypothetical protein [Persephonella sp.]|uniref:hypothetical protein n=1 Tax=Persephonella sp. TaxID=2060922 RepID=UPI00261FDC87|nr:hypothetical protein [Persephonella sp.]